ncbi:MAG: DUF3153 domain-containing protein [Leptolyngbyaceae cyanobacterium]
MAHWLKSVWRLGLILSVVMLTGCLQYDVNIQFDSQTHGRLVQQLHWRGAELATQSEWSSWLQMLSDRAAAVGGEAQLIDAQTLEIDIPFNNGPELEAKFNQFFRAQKSAPPLTILGNSPVTATLSLSQQHRFVLINNHAEIQVDLSAVPDLAQTGLPLFQGQQLLNGHFTVTAPGVRLPTDIWGPSQTWTLMPGQINRITADFWVPSPIGIGAGAIALLMLIGYGLKYWLRLG